MLYQSPRAATNARAAPSSLLLARTYLIDQTVCSKLRTLSPVILSTWSTDPVEAPLYEIKTVLRESPSLKSMILILILPASETPRPRAPTNRPQTAIKTMSSVSFPFATVSTPCPYYDPTGSGDQNDGFNSTHQPHPEQHWILDSTRGVFSELWESLLMQTPANQNLRHRYSRRDSASPIRPRSRATFLCVLHPETAQTPITQSPNVRIGADPANIRQLAKDYFDISSDGPMKEMVETYGENFANYGGPEDPFLHQYIVTCQLL